MFRTLYARLAFALALLLILVGAVVALFAVRASAMFVQELDQRFNRDLARQLVVQRGLRAGELLDADGVKALFSHYMHVNPAIEIYLLDPDGEILAFEAPDQKIKRHRIDVRPVARFLAGEALPILGDDPRHESRQKVFSAAAVPSPEAPAQYLYVVLGGEAFDSVRNLLRDSYLVRFSLAAVAGVVLFGILAGALAFRLLTLRLRRLADGMDAFREGGFRSYTPYPGGGGSDEIERLGTTFNQMAGRIREQMTALEEKDTLRRNLVANVSHDLRTPLAALQGYIETLIVKGAGLPAEERQHHLQVAHRQSERLTRLVGELFELSKLDATETLPQREPTALGDLVADTAQKFRLRAAERGIAIECRIGELPLVEADVAMLDRVLENLMENACRHAPESGWIRLTASPADGGVEVVVANSGKPIPAGDLPQLFDRFYQAPERRSGGAGLGLAIVRRILELHGAAIAVTSTEHETAFRFVIGTESE